MSDTPLGALADPYQPIYAWPSDLVPAQQVLQLVPNSSTFESPWTAAVEADALPGTLWKLSVSFSALERSEYLRARAFIARLRGSSGRFYFPAVPGSPAPAAQPPGIADGASTGPRTAGFTASGHLLALEVPTVQAGDYVSVDDERGMRHLFLVVEDASADGAGITTLVCEPRADAFDIPSGGRLHLENASGVFHLTDDAQGRITENVDDASSLSFTAYEYLRPLHFERAPF